MQEKLSFVNKNFARFLINVIIVIYIFSLADTYIYNNINKISLNDNLEEIIDKIDDTKKYYIEAEKKYIILDSDLSFLEKNINDVIKLQNGENLTMALKKYGIDDKEISKINNTISKNFSLINPGQDIFLNYNYHGKYILDSNKNNIFPQIFHLKESYCTNHIEIRLNKIEKTLYIKKSDENFILQSKDLESKKQTKVVKSVINNSLYYDAIQKGVTPMVINKMLEQYSYDIDFQRDIHKGDIFEVVFEEYYDDKSRKVKDGKLLYAGLQVQGKWYKMYRYENDFYNEKGTEIKKTLLKTPVDGARISSVFGIRKHPVLGYTRAHKGVDFAAPTGTPIYAAGDGIITHYGWGGGYGNLVSIKHNKEYSTNYAHMSRFAKGLKNGSSVKQRQIIGYIGTTGLSSGPHLHFELVKNGEKINPTKHTIQSIKALSGKSLINFNNLITSMDNKIKLAS